MGSFYLDRVDHSILPLEQLFPLAIFVQNLPKVTYGAQLFGGDGKLFWLGFGLRTPSVLQICWSELSKIL